MSDLTKSQILRAQGGDAGALDAVVRFAQDRVYPLAVRMLADPVSAQDATQEILIRVVTKLSTFKGQSAFGTWVYRVATNHLLTARKIIAQDPGLSFDAFAQDLLNGLADERTMAPEDHLMLNQLRVRCTMAMLLCLDRNHRAAYVLGEVLELDHREAAQVLDIAPATFRKRLSRARQDVQRFTAQSCGLANRAAPCSCRKRLPAALAAGRVGPTETLDQSDAPPFRDAEALADTVQADLIAAKLQRATGGLRPVADIASDVLRVVDPPG